jgi:GT2 family glycosyltransferase
MYSEETDLCFRLKKIGWKVCFTPEGTVTHFGGQSAKLDVKRTLVELYKSKNRFMRKHYGLLPALIYRSVTAVSAAVRTAVWFMKALAGEDRTIYREKALLQGRLFAWAVMGVRK